MRRLSLTALCLAVSLCLSCPKSPDPGYANALAEEPAADGLTLVEADGVERGGSFPMAPAETGAWTLVGKLGGPLLAADRAAPVYRAADSTLALFLENGSPVLLTAPAQSLVAPFPDKESFAAVDSESALTLAADGTLSREALPGKAGQALFSRSLATGDSPLGATLGAAASWAGATLSYTAGVGVVAMADGGIMAVDAATGTVLWQDADCASVPLAARGAVYWVSERGRIAARSARGDRSLGTELIGLSPGVAFAMDGERLYAAAGRLVAAFDAATLASLWKSELGFPPRHIAAAGGRLFLMGDARAAFADAATGTLSSSMELPAAPAAPPVAWEGRWCYASLDGSVYVLEPAKPHNTDPARAAMLSRLESRLAERPVGGELAAFLPFAQGAVHEGPSAFTVFSYAEPGTAGSAAVERELTAKSAGEALLLIFDAEGKELAANSDEFGSHASLRLWLEPGKLYYLAVGRSGLSPEDGPVIVNLSGPGL